MTLRRLGSHISDAHRTLVGKGIGFFCVSSPGVKQPHNTKTGEALTVHAEWRMVPILIDPVDRRRRIFISRVPYRLKTMFARNAAKLLLLQRNESRELEYKGRKKYHLGMRPAFAILGSTFWTFLRPSL